MANFPLPSNPATHEGSIHRSQQAVCLGVKNSLKRSAEGAERLLHPPPPPLRVATTANCCRALVQIWPERPSFAPTPRGESPGWARGKNGIYCANQRLLRKNKRRMPPPLETGHRPSAMALSLSIATAATSGRARIETLQDHLVMVPELVTDQLERRRHKAGLRRP